MVKEFISYEIVSATGPVNLQMAVNRKIREIHEKHANKTSLRLVFEFGSISVNPFSAELMQPFQVYAVPN